jgi:hypothetical protein
MTQSLLDAITAAVGEGTQETEIETAGGNESENEGVDGGDEVDSAGDAEGGESAESGTEEESNKDGTETEKDAEEKKLEGEQVKADADKTPEQLAAEKAAAPKVKDPVNDPLPNALKKETKERMESLITTVKQLTRKHDTAMVAVAERDEIVGLIQDTRATPEQYSDALSYLKMVNSGEPAMLEKALEQMQAEVAALAKMLGKPVPGVDMLSGYADLKEGVADGTITQQHAEELAAGRERARISTAQSTQRQQSNSSNKQWEDAVNRGRQELNTLGETLSSDPQFKAKNAILVGALKPVMAKANPADWATIYKNAYDGLKLPTVARTKTVVPAAQPMRAKAGAGGVVKQPSSMFDAINGALGGN